MRHILKIHRSLQGRIPDTDHGFAIESFDPTKDKQSWLDLNNLIFAHHPDQGNWTMQDVENRMAEPLFDADGFFLAIENHHLVGSCWTKIHRDLVNKAPVGELYVVGTHPDHHGHGIARAVSIKALNYLVDKGIKDAMLYVDADNEKALNLYKSLGFN